MRNQEDAIDREARIKKNKAIDKMEKAIISAKYAWQAATDITTDDYLDSSDKVAVAVIAAKLFDEI